MTSGQGAAYKKEEVSYNNFKLNGRFLKKDWKVDLLVSLFKNNKLNKAIKYAHIARHSPPKRR